MKRVLVLMLLLMLVAGLAVVAGCGDDEKTVETPFGDITVDEDETDYGEEEGEITYETEEGDVTYEYSEEAPSEDDLGAPIYPDSEYVPGSGGVVTGSGSEGDFATAGGEFSTEDDFEDVVDFYTDAIGEPLVMDETAGEATWMMTLSDESVVTVTVADEDGEVVISMGRLGGGE